MRAVQYAAIGLALGLLVFLFAVWLPVLRRVAEVLDIQGYARIDAFVRVRPAGEVEVLIIEVNSLPGMTPATCIFHQTALAGYTPYQFVDRILEFGKARQARAAEAPAT